LSFENHGNITKIITKTTDTALFRLPFKSSSLVISLYNYSTQLDHNGL